MDMKDKTFKDKVDAFALACQIYKNEKKELERQRHSASEPDAARRVLIKFMEEDVAYIDNMFEDIKNRFGAQARVIMWMIYVDELRLDVVGHILNLDRKKVQRLKSKYLHELFDDDQKKEK